MSKRYFCIFGVLTSILMSSSAYAQESELSRAISQLSATDKAVVISALDQLGRICDESCVPWLSDIMRHHDADVVRAACRTAMATGNPKLAPALLDIIRHHPLDEIRLEALNALTRLERPEDYRALFATLDPEKPDEIQRRILRRLPPDLRHPMVDAFAHLAQHSAFVTSIAEAYADDPILLFEALIAQIFQTSDAQVRHQLFRTLTILAPKLPSSYAISEAYTAIFWDNPTPYFEWIASIQASLSSFDAVHWLLTWGHALPKPVLLEVLEKLHGVAAQQFTDAVIQTDAHQPNILSWERDIASNPALSRAFLKLLSQFPGQHAKQIAWDLRFSQDEEIAIAAWQILGHFATEPSIAQSLVAQLGHSNPRLAIAVMHIVAQTPSLTASLVPIVSESPSFDGAGRIYLARWALVLAAHLGTLQINEAQRLILVQNAQGIIRDTWRLHAEPALYLLHALDVSLDMPTLDAFLNFRPDMQRAWLKVMPVAHTNTPLFVKTAIENSNTAVAALGWQILCQHPGWVAQWDPDALHTQWIAAIHHEDIMLSLQAVAAAGHLERTALIETLQQLLTHTDTRLAYNALWALQKLRALPHQHWLHSLYFRAPNGLLRERLGFLTGYTKKQTKSVPMSELYTRKPLVSGQWLHIQTHHHPKARAEITWIQSDQSLAIERANVFGLISIPKT